ncbi:MAG: 50S ribosomal protein L25 [Verrucomicrobia bacterium]|nr:50S ribosomal protein L25 [Verrucomicrobiota bacterium]
MASHETLQATKREQSGTGVAKKLRREGIIPAIIYGADQDNYAIQLKSNDFRDLLKKSTSDNFLVNLEIEGAKEKTKLAMVQEVQIRALTGDIFHVDFHAVKEDQILSAQLPIELTGEPEGVKSGGILDHQLRSIEVHCRPADLPEKIEIDVTHIGLDESVHVSDLKFPEGVETPMDGGVVVAMVAAPKVSTDDEESAGEAVAEGEAAAEGDGEESKD